MSKNIKKVRLLIILLFAILFCILPCKVFADSSVFGEENVSVRSQTSEVIPAGIEDGEVYALSNAYSYGWMSGPLQENDLGSNIFHYYTWTSYAQTFKFVQTDEPNTYIIYTYGLGDGDQAALCCSYSSLSLNPTVSNVYSAPYDSLSADSFESEFFGKTQ